MILKAPHMPIASWTILGSMVLCLCLGCGSQDSGESAQDGPKSRAFADIEHQYRDVFPYFPDHPKSLDLLDVLTTLASQQQRPQGVSPEDYVMRQYNNHPIGDYLFARNFDNSTSATLERDLGLCRQIERQFPECSVLAEAYKKELQLLREHKPDVFMERCDEIEADASYTSVLAALHHERARHFASISQPRQAVLDYLRLIQEDPEILYLKGMKYDAHNCMKDGGLLLERHTMDLAEDRSLVSNAGTKAVIATLQHALQYSGGDSELLPAPDQIEVENIDDSTKFLPSTQSRLFHMTRIACGLFHARRIDDARKMHDQILNLAYSWIEEPNLDPEIKADRVGQVYFVTQVLELAIRDEYDNKALDWITGRGNRPTAMHRDPLCAMNYETQTRMLNVMYESSRQAGNTELCHLAMDNFNELSLKMRDENVVVDAYRMAASSHEDEEVRAEYLLKLALYQRDTQKDKKSALASLQDLMKTYPDSGQASTARIYGGILLYELDRLDEAMSVLAEIESTEKNASIIAVALFYQARCAQDQGRMKDADAHIDRLAGEYATTSIVPQALLWKAMNKVIAQEYEDALPVLSRVVERYPASKQASEAASLIEKLKTQSNM